MTKEQAIEILRECVTSGRAITNGCHINDTEYEVLKIAINALEQQPCDDCVSREQALLALTGKNLHLMNTEELILLFDKRIKALPPVTPTRKSGLCWIERFDNESMWLECPYCHRDSIATYNYCPNCGASFKEEK